MAPLQKNVGPYIYINMRIVAGISLLAHHTQVEFLHCNLHIISKSVDAVAQSKAAMMSIKSQET